MTWLALVMIVCAGVTLVVVGLGVADMLGLPGLKAQAAAPSGWNYAYRISRLCLDRAGTGAIVVVNVRGQALEKGSVAECGSEYLTIRVYLDDTRYIDTVVRFAEITSIVIDSQDQRLPRTDDKKNK